MLVAPVVHPHGHHHRHQSRPAQINCFSKNAYGDSNRSRAITADAENTITSPTNTSSMVTVNSQRSTLTRFAMETHFTTESRRHGGLLLRISLRGGNCRGSIGGPGLLSSPCLCVSVVGKLQASVRTISLNTLPRCS